MSFGLFFIKRDLYPEFNFERMVFGILCCALGIGLLLLGKRGLCVPSLQSSHFW